jgi:hypothetical protein
VVVENRHNPTRSPATLADLTLIVRPAGKPQGVRAFTDAERAEAELYAAEHGAVVEPLPLG